MAATVIILEDTDITGFENGIIAHGVNCMGAMGSGVALAISKKWPVIRELFLKAPKGQQMLGTTHIIRIDDNLQIANMYTQVYYGNDGAKYASLEAVDKCVNDVLTYAQSMDIANVYFPLIGCLRGGLDWDSEVFPVINKRAEQHNSSLTINICKYKEKI